MQSNTYEFHDHPSHTVQQDGTLLSCEQTRRAAIVDPGGDVDRIVSVATQAPVETEKILLTYAHVDHIGATAELACQYTLPN